MDRRIRRAGFALLIAVTALPWASGAQQTPTLTESQRRLQEIRRERTQLRGELSRIRSRVGDVSAEIRNIQRQQQVSASLLREINLQLEQTARKIELGRWLFFDKRLSKNGTVACATCHMPGLAFTDGQPVSTGIYRLQGGRSAPTAINRVYSKAQFWDGRADTLWSQPLQAL